MGSNKVASSVAKLERSALPTYRLRLNKNLSVNAIDHGTMARSITLATQWMALHSAMKTRWV